MIEWLWPKQYTTASAARGHRCPRKKASQGLTASSSHSAAPKRPFTLAFHFQGLGFAVERGHRGDEPVHLQVVQLPIRAVPHEERVLRSMFDDTAVIQDQHDIGAADRRETMRDDE